jgi:Ser/Thr protein kinase RdoA (MazF antagonist)
MSRLLLAERDATRIAERFAVEAPIIAVQPFGNGLINRTYLVKTRVRDYVLQRINGAVFPHPAAILENLHRLTRHVRRYPDVGLRLPGLIESRDRTLGVWDDGGALWRMLEYLPETRALPRLETSGQADAVGRVLGRFHRVCADLDLRHMAVTLPDFHVTPVYHARLLEVLARQRLATLGDEVRAAARFVRSRDGLVEILAVAMQDGRLPLRIVHGDPKLDNILFDDGGQRVVSLIDLDTVQPGLVHQDIGDCLRSCCNRRGEAAASAVLDTALCRSILAAYADESDGLLSGAEVALLYDALRLIPFELGMRFLTDHLEGDRYFRVHTHGDNLQRALTQFALVADIEKKEQQIRRIIDQAFTGGREAPPSTAPVSRGCLVDGKACATANPGQG